MELDWSIPEPNAKGGYSSSLAPQFEALHVQRIRESAPVLVDSTNAGLLLDTIWRVASEAGLTRPALFVTLELYNLYVERQPNIVPILAAVHERQAYVWIREKPFANTRLIDIVASSHKFKQNPFRQPARLPVIEDRPPSGRRKDRAALTASIDQFAEILRPKIKEFLQQPDLPIWAPPKTTGEATKEFYRDLGIPELNRKPNLLLHDLGKNPNPHADGVFQRGKPSILCNTSGAGKTRLLFEGLCQHWGFYFVAAQDTNRVGSQDLEAMTYRMSIDPDWNPDIFQSTAQLTQNKNEAIALNRTSRVLAARWIVFRTFIEAAKQVHGESLPDNVRRDWLHFQTRSPVTMYDVDPFVACIGSCLLSERQDNLESLLLTMGKTEILGHHFNPNVDTFFFVLDEAQVAGKQFMGAFSDADGKGKRPVLGPIIQAIHTFHNATHIQYVVSGTGFSLKLFKKVLTTGVGKDVEWRIFHGVGDFIDKEVQENYIVRYLPPSFLLSLSGEALITRMYEWLRGRHRFTTRFLEELMKGVWVLNRPASPHKLLNAYIRPLADFAPLDVDNALLEQEPDVEPVEIDGFQWERIEQDRILLRKLSHSIYTYITRGTYPMWYYDHETLVEYGIARFRGENVTVEEPLALVSIMLYFESKGLTLDGNIQARFQDDKGMALEEATPFAITKLLRDGQTLSNIFGFSQPTPEWASRTACIVTGSSCEGEFQGFDIVDDQPKSKAG